MKAISGKGTEKPYEMYDLLPIVIIINLNFIIIINSTITLPDRDETEVI